MGNTAGTQVDWKSSRRQRSKKLRQEINDIKEKEIDNAIKQGRQRTSERRSLHRKVKHTITASDRAKQQAIDPIKYNFPFENLVFEGGGAKGLAYLGVAQSLKRYGILKQIKRFSGTSMGSIYAACLAAEIPIETLMRYLSMDITDIVYDARWGCCSLLPNLIRKYGWNPGDKFYDWMGEVLKEQTGDEDVTFMELYNMFGNELCVVVTNMNYMEESYFHPKTTPDMPVRLAVRMSISIPGVFQATTVDTYGEKIMYVDGGILCNYPIHCFDGWWLSLDRGDSFLERLQPLDSIPYLMSKSERFGAYNDKTLGIKSYSELEVDMWRTVLDAETGQLQPDNYPSTRLSRKVEEINEAKPIIDEHQLTVEAVNVFLKALKDTEIADKDNISREEFETIFQKGRLPKEAADRLFGKNITPTKAFDSIDINGNGKISNLELVLFISQSGISLQKRLLRFQKMEISGFRSFVEVMYESVTRNLYRVFVEDTDIKRTVGINTGYVGVFDFKLENEDKDFLLQRGDHATTTFLKNYVIKNDLKPQDEEQ